VSRLRAVVGWLTWFYFGALLLVLALLAGWGERHWLISLLLFAPPQALLLPLAVLGPACLFLRPRLLPVPIAAVVILYFGYMDFSWTRRPAPTGETLKVITYNAGQGDRGEFARFLAAEDPEIVVVQDARGRGTFLGKNYPGYYVSPRGEFALLSRSKIVRADLPPKPHWRGRPVMARFEVLRAGRPLVIYNVHLPTPRAQLNRFLSRRVLTDLFGDDEQAGGFATYREWLEARIQLARDVAAVFAAEKLPFLACGDFNTPDRGYIDRLQRAGLRDAHTEAGRGWGRTFPGANSNPIPQLGPWLRLDRCFAGRDWRPVWCRPDPGPRGQHRAVVAYFVPESP
jgi:endonuclease/exonuclease/phosphatase (EEP) superfamily protein YafD